MRLIDAERFDVFDYEEKENGAFTDGVMMVLEAIDNAPTIEPCEDAISRREALKSDVLMFDSKSGVYWIPVYHIEQLPSVAPSRPSGEWLEAVYEGQPYNVYGVMYKCSECGYVPMYMGEPIIPTTATLLFCPNCGAKMKESE